MSNSAVHQFPRIQPLDFVKGVLVLLMVLYHWLNYFVSIEGSYYRYLRFLTPSFIFITGFLIAHVYIANRTAMELKVSKRLMERGIKILIVFILLNLVRTFMIPDSRGNSMPHELWTAESLIATFVTGDVASGVNGKVAAFNILVPISYLLLISAGLVLLLRFYRHTFEVVCLILLLCIVLLAINNLEYGILGLVTVGLLGVILGYSPIERINALVRQSYWVAAAYLSYLVAVTVWDVNYPLQVIGIFINLMVIYSFGQALDKYGWVGRQILLVGRYSLVGYIIQIAILQTLYKGLRPFNFRGTSLGLSLFAALTLTIFAVAVLDRMRTRITVVDRFYKVVFG